MSFNFIGVDIGKAGFHVACADNQDHSTWQVYYISYDNPHWHVDFTNLVAPHAVVAAEPTGFHYFQPLVLALRWLRPQAELWQVSHHVTGLIREAEISSAKTDDKDARALAFIARRIQQGSPPRNVRLYLDERESAAQNLRHLVNAFRRLTKDSTRLLNQLDALGHSIWPELVRSKSTWLKCLALNAVSPVEIIHLIEQPPSELSDGRTFRWYLALAEKLPPIDCSPQVRAATISIFHRWQTIQKELDDIEPQVVALIENQPFAAVTTRWRTVPALSDMGIAALHVATRGQADLYTPDEFKTAVAVNPRTHQSSTIDHTGKKKRKGYRPAMQAMFLLTNFLLTPQASPNPIYEYHAARKQRERPAAIARRKLGSILSGIARNPNGRWPSSTGSSGSPSRPAANKKEISE